MAAITSTSLVAVGRLIPPEPARSPSAAPVMAPPVWRIALVPASVCSRTVPAPTLMFCARVRLPAITQIVAFPPFVPTPTTPSTVFTVRVLASRYSKPNPLPVTLAAMLVASLVAAVTLTASSARNTRFVARMFPPVCEMLPRSASTTPSLSAVKRTSLAPTPAVLVMVPDVWRISSPAIRSIVPPPVLVMLALIVRRSPTTALSPACCRMSPGPETSELIVSGLAATTLISPLPPVTVTPVTLPTTVMVSAPVFLTKMPPVPVVAARFEIVVSSTSPTAAMPVEAVALRLSAVILVDSALLSVIAPPAVIVTRPAPPVCSAAIAAEPVPPTVTLIATAVPSVV